MVISHAPVLPRPSAPPALPSGPVEVTEAWLRNRRLSEHTRDAYRRDVTGWLTWCAGRDLDPLRATFLHVNDYARALESTTGARSGRPLTPATVARRLSALSSWYDFLVKLGGVPANPVSGADRPRVDRDHSATVGLTPKRWTPCSTPPTRTPARPPCATGRRSRSSPTWACGSGS